jgi:predicted nucleic acid-binding protein
MIIFLDTSSLIKLYHREAGTAQLENLFSSGEITSIFLSEISTIEFNAAVWKKVRTKEIALAAANITIDLFMQDFKHFTFVNIDRSIIAHAGRLVSKYGVEGLRTLDSIQLATAVSLINRADIFSTSDNLLQVFFIAEGLPTQTKAP